MKKNPFKSSDLFEKELIDFSNKHRTVLAEHSKRISDYFEMSCFNMVVQYYEKKGYKLEVQNLQGGKFKYKCSPNGLLKNFSYFKAVLTVTQGLADTVYLYHNATVQSAFDNQVYTTPDIVVSKTNTPIETKDYYLTRKTMSYIPNDSLVTFCEAKHLVPFPELMINFIGTVHELKPECLIESAERQVSAHIAPSLMMSGTLGVPTRSIQNSFERRYYVNFFDNLFDDDTIKKHLSKYGIEFIATLGKKSDKAPSI